MSSSPRDTRTLILEAARRLFERPGADPVRLVDVAREAGISRQAVYLHFDSRARLLLALVRYVDDVHTLETQVGTAVAGHGGAEALRRFIRVWGGYVRHIDGIAYAMHHLAHTDAEAAAAWNERMQTFRKLCRGFATALEEDEQLAVGWTVDSAADLLWSMLSIRTWRELVHERRWSKARYVEHMTRAVERTFVRPPRKDPS